MKIDDATSRELLIYCMKSLEAAIDFAIEHQDLRARMSNELIKTMEWLKSDNYNTLFSVIFKCIAKDMLTWVQSRQESANHNCLIGLRDGEGSAPFGYLLSTEQLKRITGDIATLEEIKEMDMKRMKH